MGNRIDAFWKSEAQEKIKRMKHANDYRWIWLAGLLAWLCLMTIGCAGDTTVSKPRSTQKDAALDTIRLSKPSASAQPQARIEDGYELVETPFGMVQRPKKPTAAADDKTPTPDLEKSGSSQPSKVISSTDKPKKKVPVVRKAFRPAPPSKAKPGDIVLNFDNADLFEVIRTFADLLDFNFVLDSGVSGKVTLQTSRGLNRGDLWPVFFQVLEVNGLTATEEDGLFKISSSKDAARLQLRYRMGKQDPDAFPSERIMIQIIPLAYIQADEMANLIKPFVSANGTIITHDKTNTIVLVDKGAAIVKALRLVEVFDIDLFERMRHRFYTFTYVQAEEMQKLLSDILDGYSDGKKENLKLIPIERLNALLVVCDDPNLMQIVDGFVQQLDVPSEDIEPRIYVYPVENARAEDLGSLLESIFTKSVEEDRKLGKDKGASETGTAQASSGKNPLMRTGEPQPAESDAPSAAPATPSRVPGSGGGAATGASTLTGELKVTVDEVRNALIFEATPSDYRIVEGILEELDVMPRQVLIEVLIAEISLDDSSELGVEWSYLKSNELLETTVNIGSSGLSYAKNLSDKWAVALSALASENKVKVISAPSVMASDNTAASINVTTEVPVASAQYEYNDGGGVTSTTIQYRNTGIILSVTPHINKRGLVSMEISQEVSNQASGVIVADKEYPSFRQNSVTTTLTVGHEQTIVIGGLIRENHDHSESGLPLLREVPFLKYLAGRQKQTASRTELVISITPHVIVNLEDVDTITDEFKKKISF